jgi:anti-sigma-K factor RskA
MAKEYHVSELIPAYALGCLDGDEAGTVSSHLAVCDQCRAELHSYQELVGEMAFSVRQHEPPPAVKSRLMARIQADAPVALDSPQSSAWRQRLASALSNLSPAWAVAGLALLIILGISNLLLWGQIRQLRAGEPPLRVVSLQGTGNTPEAIGMVVMSVDGASGTLVVDRLPDLGEAQQYQLWLIRDGQRTSGGVFSVDSAGYGWLWIRSSEPLASYSGFGITVEPAGGSAGPTGARVLGGDL